MQATGKLDGLVARVPFKLVSGAERMRDVEFTLRREGADRAGNTPFAFGAGRTPRMHCIHGRLLFAHLSSHLGH